MIGPTSSRPDSPHAEKSKRGLTMHIKTVVSFVDEARLRYRFDHEIVGQEFIKTRVGPLLYDGFQVAVRGFEFFAYSQSALREHAVW
jgi:RNA-dependent RNA polymerase